MIFRLLRSNRKPLSLSLLVFWVVYLLIFLLLDSSPRTPEWLGPQHFSSSLFLGLLVAGVLMSWCRNKIHIGWLSMILASVLVVCLEVVQLYNPIRSFQIQDIIDGIAGAAIGGFVSWITVKLIDERFFIFLTFVVSAIALFVFPIAWLQVSIGGGVLKLNETCDISFTPFIYKKNATAVSSSEWLRLCTFGGEVQSTATGLQFYGGGVRSGDIEGLSAAIRQSGQLTLGVKFTVSKLQGGRRPREIVSISGGGKSQRYLARIYHNGKRANSSIHKSGIEYTRSTMANRLQSDTQEIVIVYDGEKQSTWYNGDLSGIDFTPLELSDIEGDELVVTMGRRPDLLWLPFNGTIEAVFISGSALNSEEIQSIFAY